MFLLGKYKKNMYTLWLYMYAKSHTKNLEHKW